MEASDDPDDAVSRLEQALERIAALAANRAAAHSDADMVSAAPSTPEFDTAELAARLDALIARVRGVLEASQT